MESDVWQIGKLDDIKSSIIKCVILVNHVHNCIGPTNQKDVSQKKKYDDIQMLKSVGLTKWLKRGFPTRSW